MSLASLVKFTNCSTASFGEFSIFGKLVIGRLDKFMEVQLVFLHKMTIYTKLAKLSKLAFNYFNIDQNFNFTKIPLNYFDINQTNQTCIHTKIWPILPNFENSY